MTDTNGTRVLTTNGSLYRICEKEKSGGLLSAGKLEEMLFTHKVCDQPEHPYFPHGEWCCQNPDCVVRWVTVRCKYLDEKPPAQPPTLYCPHCREVLEFHHYLREIALEKVVFMNIPIPV